MDRRTFVIRSTQAAVAFGVLHYLPACRPAQRSDPQFAILRERYFLWFLERNPVVSTYLGGDGYSARLAAANGRLRDYGPEAIADEVRYCREVAQRLAGIDPARLAAPDRIDHDVMAAQVRYVIRQLDERRYQERAIDSYVEEPFRGVDWQLQQMAEAPNGLLGAEGEWALVVERLDAVPAYLDTAARNLLRGKAAGNLPDRRMVARDGIAGSRASVEYFGTALVEEARRYLGTRPFAGAMARRLTDAATRAAQAYARFAAFLERTFDPADREDRYAVGQTEYEWRVRNCLQDPRDSATLYEYAAAQVEIYERQIFALAEEIAGEARLGLRFSSPEERRAGVRAVMDHLAQDSPRNDDELFEWYRAAAARAVAYGRERNLFRMPADYRLDILPMPAVLGGGGAAYYPAPPFKRTGVGRFYLGATGNSPALLRLNSRASVADTAIHEGFPGHDWHYKFMTQHAAEISNVRWLTPGAVEDSFSMWEDSMASEGWALYAEELMAEPAARRPHGFYGLDEFLYELQGQLLRAVRVRVDVGLHTGRMSFDEAVDYFTEHVEFYPGACARAGADPVARAICNGARRSIYRYSKWPTQAITYNLGKGAIVSLREEERSRQGAAFSATAFHERFMRMGTIPPGVFREAFLAG